MWQTDLSRRQGSSDLTRPKARGQTEQTLVALHQTEQTQEDPEPSRKLVESQ